MSIRGLRQYTYFEPEVADINVNLKVAGLRVKVKDPEIKIDLETHYAIAGLRFTF